MKMISLPTRSLLALSMLKGVGPAALKKVAAIKEFWDREIEDLARAVPQVERALASEAAWAKAQEAAAKQLDAADKHLSRILSPLDADYPSLLAETKDDPFLIFLKGTLARDSKSVAIIGTREPTQTGQVIAQRIAHTFVEQGWSIVSGLAIGCDAIAHRAALDAGGHTVAVLAHGLQMISPPNHKELAEDIVSAGGALVSEYPFGQGVQKQQFVKRDRTQAGLAQGVVMIQSDVKGGSLHASRAALDYNRWLAVPFPTPKDLEHGEPKVQGNLVIADGTDGEKATLLRCSPESLNRILILRDRADILRLAGAEMDLPSDVESASGELSGQIEQVSDELHQDTVETVTTSTNVALIDGQSEPRILNQPPVGGDELIDAFASESVVPPFEAELESGAERLQGTTAPMSSHSKTRKARGRASMKRPGCTLRYYVALHSVYGANDLRIAQVPPGRLLEQKSDAQTAARNIDVIVALASRLQYLQERLDEVNKLQNSLVQALDKAMSLHLQFSVEDVLMHMKRAVDVLAQLDSSKHLHIAVEIPAIEHPTQMSLIESAEVEREQHVDLAVMLEQIVQSLPQSVAMTTGSWSSKTVSRKDDEVDIELDVLVRSFNGLVIQTLGSESPLPAARRPGS